MRLSTQGLQFIQEQESLRLTPYRDIGGKWTVGYGHLMRNGESLGPITEGQALLLLEGDVTEAENAINRLVMVALSQPQFDALASFVFNVGVGAFENSTLLTDLNDGNYAMAAAQFPNWDHVNGTVSNDLFERRMAEQRMFLNGKGVAA